MKKTPSVLSEGERCDSKWCEIRPSGIHGRGLFAKRRIPQGTPVIEYVGEKIDKEESDRRGWARIAYAKKTGDAAVYIFTLNDDFDIDGNVPWNAARLINHSCEPNCELFYWVDEESDAPIEDRLWLQTIRKIAAGEEMTIDYCWPADAAIRCRCGSASCRGWIVDPDEFDQLPTSQPKAWKAYVAETKGDAPKASRKRASSKTRK